MTIEIEKGVPIPQNMTEVALKMLVGDSVYCATKAERASLRTAIYKAGCRPKTRAEKPSGWRIWKMDAKKKERI